MKTTQQNDIVKSINIVDISSSVQVPHQYKCQLNKEGGNICDN